MKFFCFKKSIDQLITNKILSLPELKSKKVSKLEKAIKYVINVGGKRLRPIIVLFLHLCAFSFNIINYFKYNVYINKNIYLTHKLKVNY